MNILVLGNTTLNPLKPALEREFSSHVGTDKNAEKTTVSFGEYNDYLLQFSDPDSHAANEKYQCIICHLDGEQLFQGSLENGGSDETDMFLQAVEQFCQSHPRITIISNTLCLPARRVETFINPVVGQFAQSSIYQECERFNRELWELSARIPNFVLFDLSQIVTQHGVAQLYSPNFWYAGRIRYTQLMFRSLAELYGQLWRAYRNQSKKVLVLDLDNTLWGGVVGEDGPLGVLLGEDGIGRCFRDFQRQILRLKASGVMLAINSKNNSEDIDEIFSRNNMMVLQKNDFVCIRTNWQDKVSNLREISEELSLGTDSFVFIDDNPVERAIVKENLPEVVVPDFPEHLELLPNWFAGDVSYKYFPKFRVTESDLKKVEQYQRNSEREKLRKTVDKQSFLESLAIEVSLLIDPLEQVERASQLTQKTNQFNMTTNRYSPAEIKAMMDSDDFAVVLLDYSDRFGKEGITGLAILDYRNTRIDTFLLSCRIIGRGVEERLLRQIEMLASSRGITKLYAEFKQTAKNSPAQGFYERSGYQQAESSIERGTTYWRTIGALE